MAFVKRTFMGKGKVSIGPVAGALQRIGNVSKLTLSIDEETKDLADYESAGGGTADSVSRVKAVTASITMHSLNKENLAMAMFGTTSTVAGATVTDESIAAVLGGTVRLAKIPTAITSVEHTSGTPTYVAGTDYVLSGGGVYFPVGSAITNAQSVLVTYTAAATNVIEALTQSAQDYTMMFEGINEADSGKACVVDIWRIKFSPAKAIDLIGDDFASLELTGKLLADDTKAVGKSKYFRYTFVE
jgi:hypothetical protein